MTHSDIQSYHCETFSYTITTEQYNYRSTTLHTIIVILLQTLQLSGLVVVIFSSMVVIELLRL